MHAEQIGNECVLRISGELTQIDVGRFKDWIVQTVGDAPTDVALDCGCLTYLDSAGLGALVFARKKIAERGGVLRMTKISGWLRKFLEVTGLEEAFRVRDSVQRS